MKYKIEQMISKEELAKKVRELGQKISQDHQGRELVMVGLLRGSVIFLADLVREISLDSKIDFMVVSSYADQMESSRDVKILKDLEEKIEGKDVLIVEDIIDTGYTLDKVAKILRLRKPASLSICTLLDKPERRLVEIPVDYVGFQITDEFVVGYGIDYAQNHRNLPYLGRVVEQG